MISGDNWSFSHYSSGELKAYITFGGEPTDENTEGYKDIYYLLLCDQDHVEISSLRFETLGLACDEINDRYGHWELVDGTANKGGCGSCSAH